MVIGTAMRGTAAKVSAELLRRRQPLYTRTAALRTASARAVVFPRRSLHRRSFAGLPIDDGAGQFSIRSSQPSYPPLGPGFGGPHDVGGVDELLGQILDVEERDLQHWEAQTHALLVMLVSKGLLTVDELRRGIEALDPVSYDNWGYYEKWAVSMATSLLERGVVTSAGLDLALGSVEGPGVLDGPRFGTGDAVRVKCEVAASRWRKPHLRTPGNGKARGSFGLHSGFCPSELLFWPLLDTTATDSKAHWRCNPLHALLFAHTTPQTLALCAAEPQGTFLG